VHVACLQSYRPIFNREGILLFSQLSAGGWLAIGKRRLDGFLDSACSTLYVFILAENHEHQKNIRRIYRQIDDPFTSIVWLAFIVGPGLATG
jgi:hypothetical protein